MTHLSMPLVTPGDFNAVLWRLVNPVGQADYTLEPDIDVFFKTITQLCDGDNQVCKELTPAGYQIVSFTRYSGAGSIAFIDRDCLHGHSSACANLPFTPNTFQMRVPSHPPTERQKQTDKL